MTIKPGKLTRNRWVRPLLTAALCFTASSLSATDLKFSHLTWRKWIDVENEWHPAFRIRNDNILTALKNSWYVQLTILDQALHTVHSSVIPGIELKPYRDTTVTASQPLVLSVTGSYKLNATIQFADDINTSNNTMTEDLAVLIGRRAAADIFLEYYSALPDSTEGWAFMKQDPLPPGTVVSSPGLPELTFTLDKYAYLGWLDPQKDARYGHTSSLILIDGMDAGKKETVHIGTWPEINGAAYLADAGSRANSTDRVAGTAPKAETVNRSETIPGGSPGSTHPDSVCVLLVSGRTTDDNEAEAFGFDLDVVSKNLSLERLGPHIQASRIHTLQNASAAEIAAAIDSLRGKCKEIYFFYTGHGWKGGMVTRDSVMGWMGYLELSDRLFATGASRVNVVLDACYSGSAVSAFQLSSVYEQRDLTLITASSKDTVSITRTIHVLPDGNTVRAGAFLWSLMLGYGDPTAERDGAQGISLPEAFEWVKAKNPELAYSRINERMDPQMLVHRRVTPSPSGVTAPDADLTLTPTNAQNPAPSFQVTLQSNGTWPDLPADATPYGYRVWSVDADSPSTKWSLDLRFQYRLGIDESLWKSGEPGLYKKSKDESSWSLAPNVSWDFTGGYVTAKDVTGNGLWILGNASAGTPVAQAMAESGVPERPWLEPNYPNPFNPWTTLAFTVPQRTRVHLAVIDVSGRTVAVLLDDSVPAGRQEFRFDAGRLASGVYVAVFQAGPWTNMRKMALVR